MNCHNIETQLDDYLDGRIEPGAQQAIREHLQHCPACRLRHKRAAALLAALRLLPATPSRPGFVEQAIARATHQPPAWRPAVGFALAASLVLGIAIGVLFAPRPADAPAPTVHVALGTPQTVRLMFNSEQPLTGVELRLTLPDHVELVGYAGRRELVWETELRVGRNLLQLPLVAHGGVQGDLVARLSHGESRKTFRVRIQTEPAGTMSTSPASLAT